LKKILNLFFITVLVMLFSCNPKITTTVSKSYPPIDYRQDIIVFGLNEKKPDEAVVIGKVKTGDTGFSTKCTYEIILNNVLLEARKAGGNAIKITEYIPPSYFKSSCHRITAEILRIKNIEKYRIIKSKEPVCNSVYAILNIYRFKDTRGSMLNYDLYLGNTFLCRVTNNFKTSLRIKKEGLNTLWAKTGTKTEVPINIKFGKTYYIKCGVSLGFFVGNPEIELMDWKTGKTEFENIKINKQQAL